MLHGAKCEGTEMETCSQGQKGQPRAPEALHLVPESSGASPKASPSPLTLQPTPACRSQFTPSSSNWFQLRSGASPRDRGRKTAPPGSPPRPATLHTHFQGPKWLTSGNQPLGIGTPPVLGRERSHLPAACMIWTKLPQFLPCVHNLRWNQGFCLFCFVF